MMMQCSGDNTKLIVDTYKNVAHVTAVSSHVSEKDTRQTESVSEVRRKLISSLPPSSLTRKILDAKRLKIFGCTIQNISPATFLEPIWNRDHGSVIIEF